MIRVTKEILTDMLTKYLNRRMTKEELVDWAENMIRDAEFENKDSGLIRKILGRLGLADVKEFGLSWDDCYDYLHGLGHDVTVMVS